MVPALILVLALAWAGCGGERSFEPAEFVEEVNREGAGLVLEGQLASTQEGVDVFELSFKLEGAAAPGEHGHGGGSLVVTEDAEAASAEHRRCEAAVTLACYRAANVVLMFEGDPTDDEIARVDGAIRALASE